MVKHGARVKITEERLEQVEAFFARRGGMTILIGRFIGLVRAIAPFIAGASHMPLRKFLPYDVLGAGLWATTFCVLGYVFWRSFDQLTTWVSRGLFAFGLVVAIVVAIVFLIRLAAQSGAAGEDEGVDRRAARQAPAAPGRAVPARGLAPDRAAGRPRVRGAGALRLEPLHARRARARGDDAARGRRRRVVHVLPARLRARRALAARRRPVRRSTSPTGSTARPVEDDRRRRHRARLVPGRGGHPRRDGDLGDHAPPLHRRGACCRSASG